MTRAVNFPLDLAQLSSRVLQTQGNFPCCLYSLKFASMVFYYARLPV